MSLADKSQAECALVVLRGDVIARARELYNRLGETMMFRDREKGFDEWDNLGDALKALNLGAEKLRDIRDIRDIRVNNA